MTEFNLSEKIWNDGQEGCNNMFYEEDIKEFIRLLKEELDNRIISNTANEICKEIIDKLAGEKLI